MKLFVNEKGEIKDVGATTNDSLIEVEVADENNPFSGWSVAKICCFKIETDNGFIVTYTPYVNCCIVEQLDKLAVLMGNEVTNTQLALVENYEKLKTTDATIVDIQMALVELYEMIIRGGIV